MGGDRHISRAIFAGHLAAPNRVHMKFIDGQRAEKRISKLHESLTKMEISDVDPFDAVMADDERW